MKAESVVETVVVIVVLVVAVAFGLQAVVAIEANKRVVQAHCLTGLDTARTAADSATAHAYCDRAAQRGYPDPRS